MADVMALLALEGAREFVRALSAGAAEWLLRIPELWRRSDEPTRERMAAELGRTATELEAAGEDAAVRIRAEAIWETRLRDLLAAHPEARTEVEGIIEQIRREAPAAPQVRQNIIASGQNATAQGVVGGSIHNHAAPGTVPPGTPASGDPAPGASPGPGAEVQVEREDRAR
ncbi:hypothetical protein [Streptomyces sp. SCSIO ZS0520]|uniref:hypothetical protein n=1 Tax=Streptomyces sp. SCSIO ZS0520 TaxID=2892996 RepID=UPI0021D9FB0F|nr:hypothetical protein [Streptomyces sp. SCSIO ZS0520]